MAMDMQRIGEERDGEHNCGERRVVTYGAVQNISVKYEILGHIPKRIPTPGIQDPKYPELFYFTA
jgi:hypothetical protein